MVRSFFPFLRVYTMLILRCMMQAEKTMVALRDTAASTSTTLLGVGDCGCEECRGRTDSLDWGERLKRVIVPGPAGGYTTLQAAVSVVLSGRNLMRRRIYGVRSWDLIVCDLGSEGSHRGEV